MVKKISYQNVLSSSDEQLIEHPAPLKQLVHIVVLDMWNNSSKSDKTRHQGLQAEGRM